MSTLSSYCCCHCVRSILLRFLSFLRVQKQRKTENEGGYQISNCSCSFTPPIELKLSISLSVCLFFFFSRTKSLQLRFNNKIATRYLQFLTNSSLFKVNSPEFGGEVVLCWSSLGLSFCLGRASIKSSHRKNHPIVARCALCFS